MSVTDHDDTLPREPIASLGDRTSKVTILQGAPWSPTAGAERVLGNLSNEAQLSDRSAKRLALIIRRLATYLETGQGVRNIREVLPDHVAEFVRAPLPSGDGFKAPSAATMHLRRSAARLFFRIARRSRLIDTDPTLDIDLPPRSSLRQRPLTDDEVALCQSFALHTLTETRQPAVWALAEATARTSEIPHTRVSDLDLDRGRVWIHGGSKTSARWAYPTEWGLMQLRRRVKSLGPSAGTDPPLVYRARGSDESRQASSCIAISETLARAGLAAEPDVGPGSVAAWAGAKAFAEGASIDEVARRLGVRSLDRAASIIGWNWLREL